MPRTTHANGYVRKQQGTGVHVSKGIQTHWKTQDATVKWCSPGEPPCSNQTILMCHRGDWPDLVAREPALKDWATVLFQAEIMIAISPVFGMNRSSRTHKLVGK